MLRNHAAVSPASESTNVEQRCPAELYSDWLPETAVFRFLAAAAEVFAIATISRQASGCTVPPVGCTERPASAPLCALILDAYVQYPSHYLSSVCSRNMLFGLAPLVA